jgi:hypothetical protein
MKWTVARFPNGSWTTGGKPSSKDYENCEVFVVEAESRESATKKAQAKRSRQRRSDWLLPDISTES